MEILGLIRSLKNTFAPINRRIPPEVFSLIPKFLDKDDMDKTLIALTHTCHGWRELFIACSSLWTRLDSKNVDKTRAYLERAKSSPLEVLLNCRSVSYHEVFRLVNPHIRQLKSLSIVEGMGPPENLAGHFPSTLPLLEELSIDLECHRSPALNGALFGGNLPSLRTLRLDGFMARLPWMNLSHLTTLELRYVPEEEAPVTQLLDFFQNAPRLRKITLFHSTPANSDAPPERVVPLPHLRELSIIAGLAHPILLHHLSIPAGAILILEFAFVGNESPFRTCLPSTTAYLKNLSRITAVNLWFNGAERSVGLHGPDGGLYMFGRRERRAGDSPSVDMDILRSFDYPALSRTQKLAITNYRSPMPTEIDDSAPYHILNHMGYLRTLTLTQCTNLLFILALNPTQNPSKRLLCPCLKELILYVKTRDSFNIAELTSMAKERALRNTRLSLITIVGLDELVPGREVFRLGEHVMRVEYRFEGKPPKWDDLAT